MFSRCPTRDDAGIDLLDFFRDARGNTKFRLRDFKKHDGRETKLWRRIARHSEFYTAENWFLLVEIERLFEVSTSYVLLC